MTIHRIRMLGDPILRTRCEPIAKPGSAAVRVIIDDLRDTLRDFQSRFGYGRALAAPQIITATTTKVRESVASIARPPMHRSADNTKGAPDWRGEFADAFR